MCGIFSAISVSRDVVPTLLQGIKQLEYRGYDSAGVAVINGTLSRVRAVGRVADLESRVQAGHLAGQVGIAHTRWATHGVPSERNAHPHVSGGIAVVHNGIIENHQAMCERLRRLGYTFTSETDTEVIAHLVHAKLQEGLSLLDAVRMAARELTGAYAIAVINEDCANEMVVARNGAPLLLGLGAGENFAASDGAALAAVTRRFVYLDDGDCAQITPHGIRIVNADGQVQQRPERQSQLSAESVELGNFRHYMQKEIFEQPQAVLQTLEGRIGKHSVLPQIFGSGADALFRDIEAIQILACGTSYHAAMVARYWLESIANIPCNVEIASEYRYREPFTHPASLVVTISQSGETADTLAALRYA
ncbi:MAG: glutamine--fructose-6-phosphate transaminase (isomerizing), partial [Betaproteobacteria bacterium]|nr:glutamine--fructose-6-phosphate transaminase (isomerizing) [Betaproteobacteria bacterium]